MSDDRDTLRLAPHEPQPTPLPVPRPRPPKRGRRALGRIARWLGFLLLLVVFSTLVSFVSWVKSDDFQRRAVPLVEHLLEQQTGEGATIDRIDVRFWPPAVEATGLRLWHVPTQETIVSVDKIRAPLVLREGGPKLGKLSILAPQIVLHVDEDGLREFRDFKKGTATLEALPWGALEVKDGSVRIEHARGYASITDLASTPTQGSLADVGGTVRVELDALVEEFPFLWRGASLGPRAIEIPELSLDAERVQVLGRAKIPLSGPLDVHLQASANLEGFNVLLAEPRRASGQLDVDATISGEGEDWAVSTSALISHLKLVLPGVNVPTLHYDFGSATVAARITKDGAEIDRVHLDIGDGSTEVWGRITRDGRLEDAHVVIEGLSMRSILMATDAAPTPWTDFDGDLEATLTGTLNPLRLEGPFELVVANWDVGDRPIADPEVSKVLSLPYAAARGQLVLFQDRVEIFAPSIVTPRNRGRCEVVIGFGPFGPLDLRFDMTQADLADFRPLGGSGLEGKGWVRGRMWGDFNALQLAGQGDLEDFEVVGIHFADRLVADVASPKMQTIELTDARATIGTTQYGGTYTIDFQDPLSMEADLVFEHGRIEDLVRVFVDVRGLTGDMEGTLKLRGPLFDMDGEAHMTLRDVAVYGERFPGGEGHGFMDRGVFTLDDLRLLREDGTAGLMLRGSVKKDYDLNMELIGDGFRLETLDHLVDYDLPLSGRASVVARIDNKIYDPAPHGRFTLADVRYSGIAVDDSAVRFTTENAITRFQGKLAGGAVALVGTLGLWNEQPYSVFASFADFPLDALYPRGADGRPVSGALSGKVDVGGTLGENPSPLALSVDIDKLALHWGRHTLRNQTPWRYVQRGDDIEMTGFSVEGGATRLALDHATRDASGLDLRGGGRIDLDLLRLFVPDLMRSEGFADVTLTAAGKDRRVQTTLEADLHAALIRHASFPAAFEDVTGQIRATDEGFDLVDVTTGIGGGTLVAGGRIDARDWRPVRWNLSGRARDAQLQWIDALPPAIGDADLRFDGPVDALLLSGQVRINDMAFTERIDWEDWVVAYRSWSVVDATPTDEAPWFSMDIDITADSTIRLRNNVADGTASAALRVIGDTNRPGLLGRVNLSDTDVYLQDRKFQVDRAQIAYRDPWTWDPDLDIELVTDILRRDIRFRVHYLIRGLLSDWRTETRSEPSLPQADINALLWFGVTADDLEGMGELPQAVAQGVADMILTDLFITRGGGVREELGLLVDRVEIVTGVDTRGEYSSDPRIVLEKRLGAADATARVEINTLRWDDWQAKTDFRISDNWSVALWFARRQRERVLSIGGAYGVDLRARWELE